jgi:hypothetical protein
MKNEKLAMKMKMILRQIACLAVAVMASVASASADPISITVPVNGQSTITDAMVNAGVSPCPGIYYRWWRNGNLVLWATADSLIISASSLTAGQTYTYHRTTRCGACGVYVTSPNGEEKRVE